MGFVTFLVVETVTVRQYVTFVIGITTVYTIGWIITVAAVCNCWVSPDTMIVLLQYPL